MKPAPERLLAALAAVSLVGGARQQASFLRRSQSRSLRIGQAPVLQPFPFPYNTNPQRKCTGYYHMGCLQDAQDKERRYYQDYGASEDHRPMTPEVCWEFCKGVSGAQYFGLQNGDQCYCTPFVHDSGDHVNQICDMPCTGDASRMCGGQRLVDAYQMHDCNNTPPVSCKKPTLPVAHAKLFTSRYYPNTTVPCRNAVTGYLDSASQSLCYVECETGYQLVENTLKCEEHGDRLLYAWAQMSGRATCEPVQCGVPNEARNARSSRMQVYYPQHVTQTCLLGYIVDGNASSTQQDQACQVDGTFEAIKDCVPVTCGSCQAQNNATVQEQGARVYKDVCTYNCASGFSLSGRPDGETRSLATCLYTGGFTQPPQCLAVVCGALPLVRFANTVADYGQAYRALYPDVVGYQCLVGYTLTGAYGDASSFQVKCEANGLFSAQPECKPVLVGNPPYVAHSLYHDRPYYYKESVTYTCDVGYTTTGEASATNQATIVAGPDGQWAQGPPTCSPVSCGAAPSFAGARSNGSLPAALTFASQAIEYVCNPGYSTSVSDNIWQPVMNIFYIACQANGTFASAPECVNINDCLIRSCGSHGGCVDSPNPTGIPIDDYTCQCDSGYEVTLQNSSLKVGELTKFCTNINDCPVPSESACGGRNAKGFARGLCSDGLNTYDCVCGAGYRVAQLESLPANQTCAPVACGTVPAFNRTSSSPEMTGKTADYDTPEWTVSCVAGYSLDGIAGGPISTAVRCMSTGAFSPVRSCLPVSCGPPMLVGNADTTSQLAEMIFGDQIVYSCDQGFALHGDPQGLRSFQIDCLASGQLSNPDTTPGGAPIVPTPLQETGGQSSTGTVTTVTTPLACLPVRCGVPPEQGNAEWNRSATYVYGQAATVRCVDGYSIDGSTNPQSATYKVACSSSGDFSSSPTCQRILCTEAPPLFPHSSSTPAGPFAYGDAVTYTLDAGYELNVSGAATINGSFTCYCDATGNYNQTCAAKDTESRPIDCGSAPAVAHGTVSGDTHFGGMLLAVADDGFTLDGTSTGLNSFNFWCQANGLFSPRQEFLCIYCGMSPGYNNLLGVYLQPGGYAPTPVQPPAALLVDLGHGVTKRISRRLVPTYYADQVTYVCATGFKAAPGSSTLSYPVAPVMPDHPSSFTMECDQTGDLIVVTTGLAKDVQCLPVTCDVVPPAADALELPRLSGSFIRLQYLDTLPYICAAGYSLDGTPTGESEFTETCQATGSMSAGHVCKDIDWCLDSRCGFSGTCVDGLYAYTCNCNAGFEVKLLDARWETCAQILECETQRGNDACSPGGGACVDGILQYACQCNPGYQSTTNSLGQDSCQAVMCPALPQKANAASEQQGQKLSYLQAASYTCQTGYTTSGNVSGSGGFTISCQVDATLGGADEECQPVACPQVGAVAFATLEGTSALVYSQSATVACQSGYTTTGVASGPNSFQVSCLASGVLSPPGSCLPVTCGPPPTVFSASSRFLETAAGGSASGAGSGGQAFYSEILLYSCAEGYSVTGQADGNTTFQVTCTASGLFTGVQACVPITCGRFPGVPNSQSSAMEVQFPDALAVVCQTGYSVDAEASGQTTFSVRCSAAGTFEGVQQCRPVTCGEPSSSFGATAAPGAKVFLEAATWTCKVGFSVDGKVYGARTFERQCQADGSYGRLSPSDCVDIDYCSTSPCSANGVCTDLGVGVPAPGYNCTCFAGYEVRLNADGSQRCSVDECYGNPCGGGGTCTDLARTGGPDGAYSCDCAAGYALTQPSPGRYTCQRVECGTLPAVSNTRTFGSMNYVVSTWQRESVIVDAFRGVPLLRSYDTAQFQCNSGFSTDGSTNPSAVTFSIACNPRGDFSRALNPTSECQPVICQDAFLPSISYAVPTRTGGFKFGDQAPYECVSGYTLSGALGGSTSFQLVCQANGNFAFTGSEPQPSCLPITCSIPPIPNTTPSLASAPFGTNVVFTCAVGYYVDGAVADAGRSYVGTCTSDGSTSFTASAAGAAPACQPAVCGTVPNQPNTQAGTAGPSLKFGNTVTYSCLPGYSLGGIFGGATTYQVSCQADGTLSGQVWAGSEAMAGGPPGAACEMALLQVRGLVTDAQDARIKLAGATVKVTRGSEQVAVAFTDASGVYTARVPAGAVNINVDAAGYLSGGIAVDLSTSLSPGQGADLALTKPLPPDGWRIILEWGKHPADLDSHTLFGCGLTQQVYYVSKTGASERSGGLQVSLDRDATTGYGPETTTLASAGRCTQVGCCLVKFKVFLYAGEGTLSTSGASVAVYQGASLVQRLPVPTCLGSNRWWTALTIDTTRGANQWYAGDKVQAPYITNAVQGVSNWATSFDAAGWSMVSATSGNLALIYGLNLQSWNQLHRLDAAQYYEVLGRTPDPARCQQVNWNGVLESQTWALCPAGYYLNGFYRTGSRYDSIDGIQQLTMAYCCTDTAETPAWGECHDTPVTSLGWSSCDSASDGSATAMVGLHATLMPGEPQVMLRTGPSARHATTSKGVFIGGNYIELGLRTNDQIGKFGTDDSPPGWPARKNGQAGLGMLADVVGFFNDPSQSSNIDYFLPGNPEESWWAGYRQSGSQQQCKNCGTSVEDTTPSTLGSVASARTTGRLNGKLLIIQTVTLSIDAKFYKNVVTLRNADTRAMQSVRFMRTMDPDNTVDQTGQYTTINTVEKTILADGMAVVTARSQAYDQYYMDSGAQAIIMYYSTDPRAKVSLGTSSDLAPNSIYNSNVYDLAVPRGRTQTIDSWISICFDVGTLAPGQETSMTYYTALDARPVSEVIEGVARAAAPTLALDTMRCCGLKPKAPLDGAATCPEPLVMGYR